MAVVPEAHEEIQSLSKIVPIVLQVSTWMC
jgi:hypothetical protein